VDGAPLLLEVDISTLQETDFGGAQAGAVAGRKSALLRLSLMTAKRRFSPSRVRDCIMPEPRLVLSLGGFFEVAIYQTE
jgi:hypothetical protein